MSSKGLEMLRKHLSYYDFDPDKVVLLGNVLYYAKKAEFEFAGLEAENAKLRELVRIAGTYCVNGLCGKDDGCPLYLGKPYCAFPDCMRELGVEVTE